VLFRGYRTKDMEQFCKTMEVLEMRHMNTSKLMIRFTLNIYHIFIFKYFIFIFFWFYIYHPNIGLYVY